MQILYRRCGAEAWQVAVDDHLPETGGHEFMVVSEPEPGWQATGNRVCTYKRVENAESARKAAAAYEGCRVNLDGREGVITPYRAKETAMDEEALDAIREAREDFRRKLAEKDPEMLDFIDRQEAHEKRPFTCKLNVVIGGQHYLMAPQSDMTPVEAFWLTLFFKRFGPPPQNFDPNSVLEWLAEKNLLRHFQVKD